LHRAGLGGEGLAGALQSIVQRPVKARKVITRPSGQRAEV
jgi:hypothetical protein